MAASTTKETKGSLQKKVQDLIAEGKRRDSEKEALSARFDSEQEVVERLTTDLFDTADRAGLLEVEKQTLLEKNEGLETELDEERNNTSALANALDYTLSILHTVRRYKGNDPEVIPFLAELALAELNNVPDEEKERLEELHDARVKEMQERIEKFFVDTEYGVPTTSFEDLQFDVSS